MKAKLLFVYNADGGLFSRITNFAHKILSPSTYPCSLYALTYDNFRMKKKWTEFLRRLNIEQEFFQKDEFLKKYAKYQTGFPAIVIDNGSALKILVPHAMIDACISLKDLEQVIIAKFESKKRMYESG